MHADYDLGLNDQITKSSNRGGERAGSGRKPGYSPKRLAEMEQLTDAELTTQVQDSTVTALIKARAMARKEAALADQAELKFKVDSREYLSRSAFREASATLLAELSQTLRSLPDLMERRHSLPPAVVQQVEQSIDEALSNVANGLELFVGSDQ